MLISPSLGTESPKSGRRGPRGPVLRRGAGRSWGTLVSEKPLICTGLQQAPSPSNPVRIFKTPVLLRQVDCLIQCRRMRKGKRQSLNPRLKTPIPMFSLCLPELQLADLVRVAIFFYSLIFNKKHHVPSPKRKLYLLGTHLQRPKPLQSNQLALSRLLPSPLPLNSQRYWPKVSPP